MSGSLQAWVDQQVARIERQPRLDLALLTDRAWDYVVHRLSYLGARVLLRTAFHAFEILLMLRSIPADWAAELLMIRTLAGVIGSLSWGALEPLRHSVREDVDAGRHARATANVEGWIGVAWLASLSLLVGVGGWTASRYAAGTITVGDLFALACTIKVTVTLLTRTFHAGVQAQRRVYRPLWAVLAPEVVDFASLFLLWPSIGLLSLVVQVLLSCALRGTLTVFFSRRAYHAGRMPMPRWITGAAHVTRLRGSDGWNAGRAALAGGMAQLDGVLVLLLLAATRAETDLSLGLLYYVLRPLMGGAHDWTRAFYADFSRGDLVGSAFFRQRLQRLLGHVALAMAIVLCALVFVATWVLWRRFPPASTLWLLPLFVARAWISLRHLEAFTQRHYPRLAALTLGVFAAVWVLSRVALTADWALVCAGMLLAAIWLGIPVTGQSGLRSQVVGLPSWIHRLSSEPRSVCIGVVCVDHRLAAPSRVVSVLKALHPTIALVRVGRSHILWYESHPERAARSEGEVVRACAGCVASARAVLGANGAEALVQAMRGALLPPVVREALALPVVDGALLEQAFLADHPGGVVLRSRTGVLPRSALPRSIQQQLMAAVAAEASGHRAQASGGAVGVYAPCGEPHLIFIAPEGKSLDSRWRSRLRAATLRGSIASA